MATNAVAAFLGGKAVFQKVIDSDLGLAREVEAGFPSASLSFVIEGLQNSGIEQTALYALIGSARTLQRKRRSHTRLSRDESDRLARLARMMVRTEEALGPLASAGMITSHKAAAVARCEAVNVNGHTSPGL